MTKEHLLAALLEVDSVSADAITPALVKTGRREIGRRLRRRAPRDSSARRF